MKWLLQSWHSHRFPVVFRRAVFVGEAREQRHSTAGLLKNLLCNEQSGRGRVKSSHKTTFSLMVCAAWPPNIGVADTSRNKSLSMFMPGLLDAAAATVSLRCDIELITKHFINMTAE